MGLCYVISSQEGWDRAAPAVLSELFIFQSIVRAERLPLVLVSVHLSSRPGETEL